MEKTCCAREFWGVECETASGCLRDRRQRDRSGHGTSQGQRRSTQDGMEGGRGGAFKIVRVMAITRDQTVLRRLLRADERDRCGSNRVVYKDILQCQRR